MAATLAAASSKFVVVAAAVTIHQVFFFPPPDSFLTFALQLEFLSPFFLQPEQHPEQKHRT